MSRIRNGIYIGIPLFIMAAIIMVVFFPFNSDNSQNQDLQSCRSGDWKCDFILFRGRDRRTAE